MPWRTFIPALVVVAACLQPITAQAPPPPRITQAVTDRQMVRLQGNTNPLARPAADRGAAAPELALDHMLLVLRRSPQQQAALAQLLDEQRENDAPQFHQWLTPAQFGARFGPAPADVATITAWLAGEGFHVDQVAAGGGTIEFSGTAANVASAFHTQMHRYQVNGAMHLANASDPSIPAALTPIVAGVASLSDFRSRPASHTVAEAVAAAPPGQTRPSLNYTDQNGVVQHALVPGDLGKIYDLGANPPAGTGETIALVARSDINPSDLSTFHQLFLPAASGQFQTIQVGTDPGIASGQDAGDAGEATLDAEWASALAPAANVDLVVAASTDTTDGVDLAAQYIVNHDLAPVMSTSFGQCEALDGAAENTFWMNLWEQAAAEGITALVSSGDDGAAGCDDPSTVATLGLAVSGVASTPYDTAVGGTEFNEAAGPGPYWSTSTTSGTTALGYIPEAVWNESSAASGNVSLWAGSGGVSSIYAKPAWQAGTGVPADQHRDLPDIALTAASHDGYVICENSSCANNGGQFSFYVVSGTSAASPTWAGIMALVDQQQGGPVGLANPVLYRLASSSPSVFHDVTTGSNAVPCTVGTPDCGPSGALGYNAGPGFDLATGWGSPDIASLLQQWGTVKFAASTTSLQLTLPQNLTYGQSVPVAIQVAAAADGGPTPTGDVALLEQDGPDQVPLQTFPLDANGGVHAATILLPAGTHNIVARYSGDMNYGSSTSPPVSVTGNKAQASAVISLLTTDAQGNLIAIADAQYGEPVVAAVQVSGAAGTVATGVVSLVASDGVYLPFGRTPQALDHGGTAYFSLYPGATAGSYTFSASYAGDGNFNSASAPPVTLTINKLPTTLQILSVTATTVEVVLETGSSYLGYDPINVQISDGTQALGTVYFQMPVLDKATGHARYDGTWTISGPLAGVTATLTAQFGGDGDYLPSTSPPFTTPTPPNLVYSPAEMDFGLVTIGESKTLSATVTNAGGMPAPMLLRADSEFNESNTCGATLLVGGSCAVSVTFQPKSIPGYGGKAEGFVSSLGVFGDLPLKALVPSFAVSVSSQVVATLTATTPAVYSLQLTPVNGFTGPVALTCENVPIAATCTVDPATPVLDGTHAVNVTITLAAAKPAVAVAARGRGQSLPPAGPEFLLLGAVLAGTGLLVRRVRLPLLLAGLVVLLACGGGASSGGGATVGSGSGGNSGGTGGAERGELQISPDMIVFGDVGVGTAAPTRPVTILNTGAIAVSMQAIDIEGGIPNPTSDFSMTQNCGATVAVGQQCQLQVGFKPSSTGVKGAELDILSSSTGSPFVVGLTGQGVPLQLVPGTYGFYVDVAAQGEDQTAAFSIIVH